jgi:hypothetical protein
MFPWLRSLIHLLEVISKRVTDAGTVPGIRMQSRGTEFAHSFHPSMLENTMTPILAKEMLGTAVRSRAGEELGTIEDFLFAPDLSLATHAIVARSAVLGSRLGESFEIEVTALVLDTENECFVVDEGPIH